MYYYININRMSERERTCLDAAFVQAENDIYLLPFKKSLIILHCLICIIYALLYYAERMLTLFAKCCRSTKEPPWWLT